MIPIKKAVPPLHVLVSFGGEVPQEVQGPALMDFEKSLRRSGLDIRVFKDRMGDDSKLRVKMTPEERNKL